MPAMAESTPARMARTGLQEKDRRARSGQEAARRAGKHRPLHVCLTRDRDVFVPLRERVNIARAARGDLFVSLHADSNDHPEMRGASVYTLSEDASDREAATLRKRKTCPM